MMMYVLFALTACLGATYLFWPLARTNKALSLTLSALMVMGCLGLWLILGGTLNLTPKSAQVTPNTMRAASSAGAATDLDPEAHKLVALLRTKLIEQDSKDPKAWSLLARYEMRLGLFDQALGTYDKAIIHSGDNSDLKAEKIAAKKYISQMTRQVNKPQAYQERGPSAEDIESAAKMSTEERAVMIENMVNGLSERLSENSQDIQGWVKLLRARKVLGKAEPLKADLRRMKSAFKDQPEQITTILKASGISVD